TLLFTANDGANGDALWRSDGTPAGTVVVKAISAGNLIDVSGTLFFTGYDGTTGRELWTSDGTAPGTVLVKDINPSGGAFPAPYQVTLANVSGTLFFAADDGTTGLELWTSDGTAAGTVLVKDINLGSVTSFPEELTNVNGTLFFQANDGTYAG